MYINPRRKAKLMKKMLREERLIRQNPEVYDHYTGIGFERQGAIKYTKKEIPSRSVERLQKLYDLKVDTPGVEGITLQGIRRTAKVEKWIKEKEAKGLVEDKGYMLRFLKQV